MWLVAAALLSQKEWKSSIRTTKQSIQSLLNFHKSTAFLEAYRQRHFFLSTTATNLSLLEDWCQCYNIYCLQSSDAKTQKARVFVPYCLE
jgi:hypothetical protein